MSDKIVSDKEINEENLKDVDGGMFYNQTWHSKIESIEAEPKDMNFNASGVRSSSKVSTENDRRRR